MAVDDHGLEVLKKAGEQVTPGDASDYYIKIAGVPGGTPVPVAVAAVATPTIHQVSAPVAGTEYSQALSLSAKRFTLSSQDGRTTIQIAYTSGQSGTNFRTVWPGCEYTEENLSLTGILTVYFQTDKAGQTIEIIEWS